MTLHHSYIGCDISKAAIDLFDAGRGTHHRIANTPRAIAAHLTAYRGRAVRFVFEATGAYGEALRRQLARADLSGCQVNPMRGRRFAQSLGRMAKTDRIDARTLADMGQRLALPPTAAFEPETEALRGLIARRDQLVAQRAAEKKRLAQTSLRPVRASISRAVEALDAEIAHFDGLIAKATRTPKLAPKLRLLRSVPGMGPTTATVLVACLPELGALTPKRIASLAGLAPFANDSGTKQQARFIQGGRARVRRALYMAALSTLRSRSRLRHTYDRLITNGKAPKSALIAVARKILVIANAIIRDQNAYA